MKPIKLDEFLKQTSHKPSAPALNLVDFGLEHSAPWENDTQILALRYDAKHDRLMPIHG